MIGSPESAGQAARRARASIAVPPPLSLIVGNGDPNHCPVLGELHGSPWGRHQFPKRCYGGTGSFRARLPLALIKVS